MIAKCANAACPERFEYHAGGSFFRFSVVSANPSISDEAFPRLGNVHAVEHFWLCARCTESYTIVCQKGAGVFLQPRAIEGPVAEVKKKTAAA